MPRVVAPRAEKRPGRPLFREVEHHRGQVGPCRIVLHDLLPHAEWPWSGIFDAGGSYPTSVRNAAARGITARCPKP